MKTALIIDDQEEIGEILSIFLESSFSSTVCTDPSKALELIDKMSYDVIITDLHMPEVDGFAIISHAKNTQKQSPIIVLTGNSENDPESLKALQLGACGIVAKPFSSPELLLKQIESLINSH